MHFKKVLFPIFLSILFSSGHIENPDTHLRLRQAMSLVKHGDFSVPEEVGDFSHGNLARNTEGKKFSVYNPGQILLFCPIYYMVSRILNDEHSVYYTTAFLISFLGYLVLGMLINTFYRTGLHLGISKRIALITTIIFGLSSYCFAHAQDSYEHIYEAYFLLITLFTIVKKPNSYNQIIKAGILLGIGSIFRTSICVAIPGLLLLIRNTRLRIAFVSSIAPFFGMLFFYNYARFGNLFESGYQIAWNTAYGLTKLDSFKLATLPKNIFGLLLSFGKGLIFFSPSITLVVLSFKSCYGSNRKLFISITTITICYVIFYGLNFAWHGSAWCWGPRYLIPIIPLLYLMLFYNSFRQFRLFTLVFCISFITQLLAVSTFYKRDLIKTYVREGDIFWQDRYFFSPKYSPIKGQIVNLWDVSKSISSKNPKHLFLAPGAWKNEARPASQDLMLKSSIDLNSYNFWWARLSIMMKNVWLKLLLLLMIFSLAIICFSQLNILWKETVN